MVKLKYWTDRNVSYNSGTAIYSGRVVKVLGGFSHNERYALQTKEGDLIPLSIHGRFNRVIAEGKNSLARRVKQINALGLTA